MEDIKQKVADFEAAQEANLSRLSGAIEAVRADLRTNSANAGGPEIIEKIRSIERETAKSSETFGKFRNDAVLGSSFFKSIDDGLNDIYDEAIKVLNIGEGKDFDARFAENMVKRFGAIIFLFFTITILGSRYKYLTEAAAHYDSLADSIELIFSYNNDSDMKKKYDHMLDLALRPIIMTKEPKNPGDGILSGIRELVSGLNSRHQTKDME